MQKSVKTRGLALLATVALLGGTAWIATATTGAYFSDTHTGEINGSIGSIQVVANGSTGANSRSWTDSARARAAFAERAASSPCPPYARSLTSST